MVWVLSTQLPVQYRHLFRFEGQMGLRAGVGVPQIARAASRAANGCLHEPAVAPFQAHLKPASGFEPRDAAIGPHHREGGQELDGSFMALNQHLGHGRHSPEVPVDLKRRMCIEEVGVGSCLLYTSDAADE